MCIRDSLSIILITAQMTYLEFLERTSNSITMRRCDDCVSNAIDLSSSPVPFGDFYHVVAHVSCNVSGDLNFTSVKSYRLQPMESSLLGMNSPTLLQLCSLMKLTALYLILLWLHPTGETLTTGTWERFGMRHIQLDRAQPLTHCWNEYQIL